MEQQTGILKLQTVEEITLVYKTRIKPSQRPKCKTSADVYKLLMANWDLDVIELQEQFKILFLNRAGRALGIYDLSRGGIAGTVVDPRLIIAAAIKCPATGIILAHNHPSGNLQARQADQALTTRIKDAAMLFDINLLDHLIITSEGYLSFSDQGLL